VTAPDADRESGIGVHAVYPHLSYDMDLMHRYFAALNDVWDACFRLVHHRYQGESSRPSLRDRLQNSAEKLRHNQLIVSDPTSDPSEPRLSAVPPQTRSPWPPTRLRVHRLSIGSPMVITFAVEGGAAVVVSYSAYLFAQVLRSPETIGAWLPRLVAGWHQGWRQAESEKSGRHAAVSIEGEPRDPRPQEIRELIEAGNSLVELHMKAGEVTAIGVDILPDDVS
jgi:hypothetical protein